MEKFHFDDLTKIDKPFEELDDATKGALLLAHLRGEVIERVKTGLVVADPAWFNDEIYRVQPKPLTKPSIDWSHVADGWDWMAKSVFGDVLLFREKPTIPVGRSFWDAGTWTNARTHSTMTVGTCDWKDSLVERPKK